MPSQLSIADILKRPIFQDARLIAGTAGLLKPVRWVHILEAKQVQNMIHGGELVLTTGIGAADGDDELFSYVSQLIDGGAVGVCIELGTVLQGIPNSIQDLANAVGFPLIIFPTEVHFVDITKDIHSLIVARQHEWSSSLDDISRKLRNTSLHTPGVQNVLRTLSDITGCPVLYEAQGSKPLIFPKSLRRVFDNSEHLLQDLGITGESTTKPTQATLPTCYDSVFGNGQDIVVGPVCVLGAPRASLILISTKEQQASDLIPILERAVEVLAQEEFRQLSIKEKLSLSEQTWVEQLVTDTTSTFAKQQVERLHGAFRIIVLRWAELMQNAWDLQEESREDLRTDTAMMIRLLFRKHQLRPWICVRSTEAVVIVGEVCAMEELRHRLTNIYQNLKELSEHAVFSDLAVGVSNEIESLNSAQRAYEQSAIAASLHFAANPVGAKSPLVFYSDIGIYRWMTVLKDSPKIQNLICEDLQQLIDYDMKYHSELVKTLKTYLDCSLSKQQTADVLYIHRQTLYRRLEQISELLTANLEDPAVRLAIHLALYVQSFLSN